jgi:thioredoxin-like negative regulator of GroEL
MSRGRTADGERAYNDARVLYPVSPEATFRYVQDVLMRQRRYAEALEAVGYFCRQDPNNDRGPYVRGVIEDIVRDEERLKELTERFATGAEPTPAEAFEMAALMLKTGSHGRARQLLVGFIDRQGLSVADCLKLAKLLDETGDTAGAARAMDRVWRKNSVRQNADALRTAVDIYQRTGDIEKLSELLPLAVKASPTDWRAWLALCGLRAAKGDMDTAAKALEEAVRYGGDSVADAIQKNPSLMEVYRHLVETKRRAAPQRMPGAPW